MPKFIKQIFGDPYINQLIAEVEGQKTHTRPFLWESEDKSYSHITGGIILPTFDVPGYLLTVGVDPNTNKIECLDEYESSDPYAMIQKAQDIQTEYGPVISNWWGNPVSLMPLVNEINIEGNPVFISAPVDSNQPDVFHIYLARLKVALSKQLKALQIEDCDILRNHISSFVQDKQAKESNHPALYITGAIIHTLLMTRPWEQAVEKLKLIPTTTEEYASYENEQAEKAIFAEIYGGI